MNSKHSRGRCTIMLSSHLATFSLSALSPATILLPSASSVNRLVYLCILIPYLLLPFLSLHSPCFSLCLPSINRSLVLLSSTPQLISTILSLSRFFLSICLSSIFRILAVSLPSFLFSPIFYLYPFSCFPLFSCVFYLSVWLYFLSTSSNPS